MAWKLIYGYAQEERVFDDITAACVAWRDLKGLDRWHASLTWIGPGPLPADFVPELEAFRAQAILDGADPLVVNNLVAKTRDANEAAKAHMRAMGYAAGESINRIIRAGFRGTS